MCSSSGRRRWVAGRAKRCGLGSTPARGHGRRRGRGLEDRPGIGGAVVSVRSTTWSWETCGLPTESTTQVSDAVGSKGDCDCWCEDYRHNWVEVATVRKSGG
ncbi:hypothetical protein M0R45_020325 [Rubus argutus]|uniref:Uncharacterized protein n=1 Tax=Rubus argutus TaxID=59490 RepID=A0AAW1X8Z1_RUBAR